MMDKLLSLVKFGEANNHEILGNVAVITAAFLVVIFFAMLNCAPCGKFVQYALSRVGIDMYSVASFNSQDRAARLLRHQHLPLPKCRT